MKKVRTLLASATLMIVAVIPAHAQNGYSSQSATASNQPSASPSGTVFLAGLQETLSTKDDKKGKEFTVVTLEPVTTASGRVIPSGAEIRGHIDRVEPAHQTGRGRMWLTFDDIRTPGGWVPIVAIVSDVPGVHSVKVDYQQEGEIEARTSKRQEEAQAALAGAFVGASAGVMNHDAKGAATGAAVGAATAFMVASGLGQDVTLEKNTKLELSLERQLYLRGE